VLNESPVDVDESTELDDDHSVNIGALVVVSDTADSWTSEEDRLVDEAVTSFMADCGDVASTGAVDAEDSKLQESAESVAESSSLRALVYGVVG
jgi:hypothetical protein